MKKADIPEALIDNFQENLGVFFVGAGLSIASGYPTWGGLIEELISEAEKISWIPKEKTDEYRRLSGDSSKFLFLAEELRVELGSHFTKYMEKRFQISAHKYTNNHELIVKTQSSLAVTVNYDDLIEQAYNAVYGVYPNVFIYSQAKEAANNYWKNRFFILKAHGDAKRDIDTLILSQKDYRKTLYREPGYRSLLQSIFTTKSIFFVGVSLSDPEFNQLLDFLHDSYHGGGPTHYLLVDKEQCMETVSRRYFDDFNIQTITFDNTKGDYAELTMALEILQSEAPRK
jgi:hypothetical protein